jgi:Fe(3+) dicitrate transport protein
VFQELLFGKMKDLEYKLCGVRGLRSNRSWELNTRQNGYDISSDVFWLPRSVIQPSIRSGRNIELVRWRRFVEFASVWRNGKLRFKTREQNKKFSFETQNTAGAIT